MKAKRMTELQEQERAAIEKYQAVRKTYLIAVEVLDRCGADVLRVHEELSKIQSRMDYLEEGHKAPPHGSWRLDKPSLEYPNSPEEPDVRGGRKWRLG